MKKFALGFVLATTLLSSAVSFAEEAATNAAENQATVVAQEVLQVANQALVVTDKNAAGYLTLTNADAKDVVVLGVTAGDVANKAEFHKTVTDEKGVSTMQPVDKIVVPAGGSFEFKQGADHIMLTGLKGALKAGDKVKVTLHFEGGKTQDVEFVVKNPGDVK